MMETVVRYLLDFLFTLPVILVSLSVHELSHGLISDKLGDPTARNMGRLTLNPIKHIDPFGFIALLFFHVGWAKPVMVDTRYFKKPKRDMALTALAGPVSNFILAVLFSFIFVGLVRFVPDNNYSSVIAYLNGLASLSGGVSVGAVITVLAYYFVFINIGLGVFNLIPIPPLDGSKIIYAFLPDRVLMRILPYERYIQIVLFVLVWLGVLSTPIHYLTSAVYSFLIRIATGVFF
ncbi:MAG: site-2 protease family protein [Clostridia bacterium]|nr:site-2 protease family protein [Clostridia bacterium]